MVVDYELIESVAWIRLNRPERLNAVVPELTEALVAALERAGQDGARVIVLHQARILADGPRDEVVACARAADMGAAFDRLTAREAP